MHAIAAVTQMWMALTLDTRLEKNKGKREGEKEGGKLKKTLHPHARLFLGLGGLVGAGLVATGY